MRDGPLHFRACGRVVVALALAAAHAAAQDASPAPSAPPRPSTPALDGTWKGTTSQEKPISLGVKNDALTEFRLGWVIEFDKVCRPPDSNIPMKSRQGIHVLRFQAPEALTAGNIKTQVGVESDLDLTLSGTFTAEGASGQIEVATIPSSPCKGSAKATWKAKRE